MADVSVETTDVTEVEEDVSCRGKIAAKVDGAVRATKKMEPYLL